MRIVFLAVLAILSSGLGLAQAPFPDVPPGHWAEEAVGAVADECIVTGFPAGEFRGDEPLTRYDVAVIAGRLLDAADRRLQAVRDEPGGLAEAEAELLAVAERVRSLVRRVERVAEDRQAVYDALEARVEALEAEVARLRASLYGEDVPSEPAATTADAASGPAPTTAVPAASPAAPAPARPPPLRGPSRPWRVGLAVGAAPQGAPLLRAVGEHEDLLPFAALRASAEVRMGGSGPGDVALAAHLVHRSEPRRYGAACWSGYVGAGFGYRMGTAGDPAVGGPFLGAVLGAELPLDVQVNLFVETAVEYHLAPGTTGGGVPASPVRPSVAAGFVYRF